jgi:hypothetical protein
LAGIWVRLDRARSRVGFLVGSSLVRIESLVTAPSACAADLAPPRSCPRRLSGSGPSAAVPAPPVGPSLAHSVVAFRLQPPGESGIVISDVTRHRSPVARRPFPLRTGCGGGSGARCSGSSTGPPARTAGGGATPGRRAPCTCAHPSTRMHIGLCHATRRPAARRWGCAGSVHPPRGGYPDRQTDGTLFHPPVPAAS